MKKTIQLNEADITRMVMEAVNELDWKTYANAAKKRYAQYHDGQEQDNNLFDKAYKLNQMANQRFNDEEEQLPGYDAPTYINCSSEEDADMKVEIGYSDYSSSLFYVGECGSDAGCALEAIVNYLAENGIIECYTADTDLCDERDCVEINGYYIPSHMIDIEQLCDNHGNSRKLREAVNRALRKYLR